MEAEKAVQAVAAAVPKNTDQTPMAAATRKNRRFSTLGGAAAGLAGGVGRAGIAGLGGAGGAAADGAAAGSALGAAPGVGLIGSDIFARGSGQKECMAHGQ
jgi:hypothetical protein